MTQVKFFWGATLNECEDRCNKWLEENSKTCELVSANPFIDYDNEDAEWYYYILAIYRVTGAKDAK